MKQRDRINLNITPIIDIVFILFTFFLVATSFKKSEAELNVVLPTTNNYQKHSINKSIKLSITNSKISIDDKIIKIENLEFAIKSIESNKLIEIRIDQNVKYQKISKVLDILQKNKLNKISLITKNKN